MHSLYARLLAAENALVGQERTTTAGFLALGAAHEFKNILSLVRLAAHRGLAQKVPGEKDACLRLIVEHTNTARDSAIEVLERISSNGERRPALSMLRGISQAPFAGQAPPCGERGSSSRLTSAEESPSVRVGSTWSRSS